MVEKKYRVRLLMDEVVDVIAADEDDARREALYRFALEKGEFVETEIVGVDNGREDDL